MKQSGCKVDGAIWLWRKRAVPSPGWGCGYAGSCRAGSSCWKSSPVPVALLWLHANVDQKSMQPCSRTHYTHKTTCPPTTHCDAVTQMEQRSEGGWIRGGLQTSNTKVRQAAMLWPTERCQATFSWTIMFNRIQNVRTCTTIRGRTQWVHLPPLPLNGCRKKERKKEYIRIMVSILACQM